MATAYSRAWCRRFARQFFDAITARELRDMVYKYVLGEAIDSRLVHILGPRTWSMDKWPNSTYGPFRPFAEQNKLPYHLDMGSMGIQFANEISEIFYEKAFWSLEDSDCLSSFLRYGPLQRSPIRHPHELIRKLEINLSIAPYEQDPAKANWMREKFASKRDYEHQASLVSDCHMIKHLDGLDLQIKVHAFQEDCAEKFEEALVPVVYELKAKGAKVTVTCPGYLEGSVPSFDYDKPLAAWEEKIRTDSVFVSAQRPF